MLETFAFVDSGRTFTCCVETARRPDAEAWWWFRVSTDEHQRAEGQVDHDGQAGNMTGELLDVDDQRHLTRDLRVCEELSQDAPAKR